MHVEIMHKISRSPNLESFVCSTVCRVIVTFNLHKILSIIESIVA